MKRGITRILLICLMVTSMVLASCTTKTTSSIPTSTTTTKTTTSTKTTTTITTATTPPITTATTTTTTGNWWDSLGTPQYGGTMTLRLVTNIANWDPSLLEPLSNIMGGYMEKLTTDNWALDPTVFNFSVNYRPDEYLQGQLAKSWEFTDPSTYVVHLRQGIHWQDIPPVNGREFTADDVVYHYDRWSGLGDGFTKPSVGAAAQTVWLQLASVTAIDKYTVAFKWKVSNPQFINETIQSSSGSHCEAPREAVEKWGDLTDWHHAIGTGPFILQDFVDGSSVTLVRNPNYWGHDERYPQNQLPYVDTIKDLIIPDEATTLAAVRTGKIDFYDGVSLSNAQSLQKTNPEILQIESPLSYGITVDPRNDKAPFNDIRVREAMQMALDLPTIANTYYNGTADPHPYSLTSKYLTGWGFPYDQWPQDLKDEYAYNPTQAKALLSAAGFPTGFKTNIVVMSTVDLNVFQIVKSYFAAIGIDMDIRVMDNASWVSFVQNNKQNDQMSSQPSGELGFSTELFRELTRFTTGYSANYSRVSDPAYDAFYNKALAATSINDVKTLVRDANEYVARHHFTISLCQPSTFTLYQPWLKGYTGQWQAIGGRSYMLLGFYGARFWIDQNVKKSLGH